MQNNQTHHFGINLIINTRAALKHIKTPIDRLIFPYVSMAYIYNKNQIRFCSIDKQITE